METKKTKPPKLPRAALKLRQADPFYEQEVARYAQPLPSRAYLLQILTERGAPMEPAELAELFAIQPEEADFFARRINAMAREGDVVINRKGALCIAEKLDLIKGRVVGHPDGFGFVVPDDASGDLFVGPKEMHKVLHGDRVMVREIGVDRRGRREGKIVEVLEHVHDRLVGRLFVERGVRFIRAEERRITQEILVSPEGSLDAEPGQVVTVELVTQPNRYSQPIGRIVEVLGNYADPGMEIEIALRKHDLPHVFSPDAEAQARKTPQKVLKKDWKTAEGLKRVDLRELPLVTIDGETARDFDDAVYAEKAGKGWRLVVAIADVSHYVQPGDALDRDGYERGNSVYFPRRVIPMLPEELSNGICSLNPEVERCCMVCDMQIDAKGELGKYSFYPAVMLSKARLTYTEVWEVLQDPKGEAAKARKAVAGHLADLYALFGVLLKARNRRGAIDFETTETRMVFNEAGKIERIEPVMRNDAHRLIEECMLAANVCAADFLGKHQHTALYRIHEGPTERKLENLRRFLNERGLSLGGGDEPQAKDYALLMEQVKGRPDTALLQTMLLRSMQQAVYSPERLGHFGLAYDAYTHFTSPIRRYPDLLVHRSIRAVLAGTTYKPGKWEEIGAHCSQTERRADEATRDVENWLKCYFMRDRLGEVFDGVISAVTNFGLFVLLDGLFVEGLVHISELGADYFRYDEAGHCLRGERSGKVYGLTDKLTVKVARVDIETSKIDFVLVEKAQAASAGQDEQPAGRDAAPRSGGKRSGKAKKDQPAVAAPAASSPEVAAAPAPEPAPAPAPAPVAEARPGRSRSKKRTPSALVSAAAPVDTAVAAAPSAPAPAPVPAPAPAPLGRGRKPAQVAALLMPPVGETPAPQVVAVVDLPLPSTADEGRGKRTRRSDAQAVAAKPAGGRTGAGGKAAKPAAEAKPAEPAGKKRKQAKAAKPEPSAKANPPAPKAKPAAKPSSPPAPAGAGEPAAEAKPAKTRSRRKKPVQN